MFEEIMKKRKEDHINGFLETYRTGNNGFEDVVILNNSLPEVNYEEVDTSTYFLNKKTSAPVMINAITGGGEKSKRINAQLANIAKKCNIPMAVGSQSIGLKYKECRESFSIVRDILGEDGTLIANLSANKSVEDVKKAVHMIKADGVQLHLNVIQELCMKEGDRDFKGILKNIENIVRAIDVPVIAKEVGFGISYESAKKLRDIGVEYIDVGGKGGTNFVEIEDYRYDKSKYKEFSQWGIPTAHSLLMVGRAYPECNIISSGGIFKGEDIVKSLIMGAEIAGISGMILKILIDKGEDGALQYMNDIIESIKMHMTLLGASNISELRAVKPLYRGDLKELNDIIR